MFWMKFCLNIFLAYFVALFKLLYFEIDFSYVIIAMHVEIP